MNARNARMIHESTFSESTLAVAIGATLVILLVSAAMPSANAPFPTASSPIDASAAVPVIASRMPAPDSRATDGNVIDLTF
jgi:C4-dicarboxylate transporter